MLLQFITSSVLNINILLEILESYDQKVIEKIYEIIKYYAEKKRRQDLIRKNLEKIN